MTTTNMRNNRIFEKKENKIRLPRYARNDVKKLKRLLRRYTPRNDSKKLKKLLHYACNN
jgi:hypothetical protein